MSEFKAGPPGGEDSENTTKGIKQRLNSIGQRIVPLIWIGVDGYILYAFCYVVVWHHIRQRNRGAAIAILVLFCVLNLYVVIAWVAMFAWGPGRITKKYTEKTEANPDGAFICDEQGYSLYCSYCKHIKPNRTHHASFTDTCIPTMDHYCPWVGTVIGQSNVKFFLQFSWSMFAAILLVMITLFIYQHNQVPHINGNSIALYVIAGFSFGFLILLVLQHGFYIACAQTTLEHMGYRRDHLPYINLLWRDGQRRVIQPTRKDIMMPRPSPFSHGAWVNIMSIMGPIYTWILPIRSPIYEPEFSPQFLEVMRGRIKE